MKMALACGSTSLATAVWSFMMIAFQIDRLDSRLDRCHSLMTLPHLRKHLMETMVLQ